MKALKHQAFGFLYRMIQRYPAMAILNERSLKKFSFYVGFCGGFILIFDQLWMSFGGIFSMMYLKITCFVVLPSFTGTKYVFIRDDVPIFWRNLTVGGLHPHFSSCFCWANPDFRGVIFPNFLHAVYEVVSNEIDPKAGVSAHSHGSHGPCSFMIYLWKTVDFS